MSDPILSSVIGLALCCVSYWAGRHHEADKAKTDWDAYMSHLEAERAKVRKTFKVLVGRPGT